MDARKWSGKLSNWDISDIFLSLSSIEGRNQRRRPETIAPEDKAIGESTARKWFSRLQRIVLTLVTLHVQGDFRGLMNIVKTH